MPSSAFLLACPLLLFPALAILLASSLPSSAADIPPEAKTWSAACKTTPPPQYTEAVARIISRMQAEKLWDKCGLLLFFAAHESTPEAFNLKGADPSKMKFAGPVEHQPGPSAPIAWRHLWAHP